MTFEDLKFEPRRSGLGGVQAVVFFPNGYGASVVQGYGTYGNDEGLYELAVLAGDSDQWSLTYETPLTDDVFGYLSQADVDEKLAAIAALAEQPA